MPQSQSTPVTRHSSSAPPVTADDAVAVEEPLEIRVEGRSVALTMRTPGHDEELAMGFLCTEGVLTSIDDVLDLDVCSATDGGPGNIIDVKLRDASAVDLDQLSRHVFTSSSCGLCGKATIDAVRAHCPRINVGRALRPTPATLLALPARLHAAQATFQATGGLHGAALFTAAGEFIAVREDVGRHNAVDKVIGRLLIDRRAERDDLGLLVSGRIAFEIVQKALTARIGLIAGISAPTSLAVDLARTSGQTLVGFLRDDRFNVYAGQLT
ncbi:formate dehydrogenase accessory sulfurtransferase FdhD [Synoicihabitans lomoniglobus]|uniref:Sulfur carrier protein FdhD n=1 Tax=Synoicihabitans lomoniglobus TaxID=2909285 RepID=A0AAF0CNC0_9BACT|nr:formate dehydrogenase accessory sulfurtransferase FdhD [Opitutaceae bacterium LMO-M01]WED65313.1 formate dehydrogenase accessory sulfurtransferase FdhD [Opitutaceae bacterium LMO-M01]